MCQNAFLLGKVLSQQSRVSEDDNSRSVPARASKETLAVPTMNIEEKKHSMMGLGEKNPKNKPKPNKKITNKNQSSLHSSLGHAKPKMQSMQVKAHYRLQNCSSV